MFLLQGIPIIGQESIPQSECPYEPADTCTGSQPKTCCERVAGGGDTTFFSSLVIALCCLLCQLKLQ